MEGSAGLLVPIGRALIGLLFVIGGVRHFLAFDEVAAAVRAQGVPWPRAALGVASAFELVAGLLLMLGLLVPLAAAGLIAFTIVVSAVMLNFWSQTGEARSVLLGFFLANVAVIGGLLMVLAEALA